MSTAPEEVTLSMVFKFADQKQADEFFEAKIMPIYMEQTQYPRVAAVSTGSFLDMIKAMRGPK